MLELAAEARRAAAAFLLRETLGSLMKTHSRPREVHLEHGHSRLHLILEAAQAWHDLRRERLAFLLMTVRDGGRWAVAGEVYARVTAGALMTSEKVAASELGIASLKKKEHG